MGRFSGRRQVGLAHTREVFKMTLLFTDDGDLSTPNRAVLLWLPEITTATEQERRERPFFSQQATSSFQWVRGSQEKAYDNCLAQIGEWTMTNSPDDEPVIVVTEGDEVVNNSPFYKICALTTNAIPDPNLQRHLALARLAAAEFHIPIREVTRRIVSGS